ncbi:MAG TPA: MMPL family transporter [Gaiella sp.]|uniref:MMPL family transporter n=1 Tax=Gaiella sp. TaxID=2663207 RepID=UPI002D7F32A8|nr:MMPL family transporter [Gaiella sp.]HET9287600.1 MMPL family transporter [Gaiella sp.]
MSPLKQSRSFAARMGGWSASHWKTAVFGWLAFVVVSVFVSMQLGTTFIDQNEANVGESRKADQIIDRAGFNVDANGETIEEQGEMVLLQSKTLTVQDPAFRAAIQDAVRTVRSFPEAQKLKSPLAVAHPDLVSQDGRSAMVQFTPEGTYEEAILYIDEIVAAVDKVEARHPGFSIESLGVSSEKAIDAEIQGGLAKAGLLSIPLTILILLVVLRSLVAALIPLLLGVTAVMATMGPLALSSKLIPASENIMEVVLLIGLAVGVDYALFYMRRERQERAAGRSERAALEAAAATSGRAVLVSGVTVLIAMAGMFLSGDKTFMSFSVGTMVVVAVAMIASLTVLPAVIGRLGDKVEKGKVPFVARRRRSESRLWGAVIDRVLRRPLVSALAAAAVLVALALPALQLHTSQTGIEGFRSPAVEPFERLTAAFPGAPEPAVLAIEADDVTSPAVRDAVADLERKALATGEMNPPIDVETNRDGTVTRVEIPLAGNGTDNESTAALATLRDDLLPQTLGQVDGVDYAVTGMTANSRDFNESQTSSAPKVFGFVLLFAFGLLLVSFRSIVIALKAIVLNLLSVAAAYGVLVAIFQWGWGENLLDFESNGGIANWLPMFMFVILFGLSMDYHVFILSRIREAYDRGLETDDAISYGIRSTAGVVTSAAVVMVAVFAVFVTLPLVDLKEMGLGLAVAVLIDATIVRAVLLPATMKLLGDANWYLPSWLQWLPRLEHERAPAPEPEPAPAAA